VRFSRDLCLQLDQALDRHWLETDGLGGYAASTLLACPTSRFHGLLVAPSREQPKRHVYLSRFEESFVGDGREFPISSARYAGTFSPEGHRFVDRCEFTPRPQFTYRIGHVVVTREIQTVAGRPAVLTRYTATGQRKPVEMYLRPLFPCRRADSLAWINDGLDESVEGLENGIAVQPYAALPKVFVTVGGAASFEQEPTWYRGIEYGDDIVRGYEGHEDQWSPGCLRIVLESGSEVVVAASIGEPVSAPASAWSGEVTLRDATEASRSEGVRGVLERAAEQFLYRTPDGRPGVIAGYPWFEEWGRDTLIALPGLTLPRGDLDSCGEILSAVRPFLRNGLLPNVFGEHPDASDYKAVDPAMWYGRAVRLYDEAGGDEGRLLDELLPALLEIARTHRAANRPGLSCDSRGLLTAGSTEVATTWMDAVVDGRPVTPRDGQQVEVNALWYVLIDTVARLLERRGDRGDARGWRRFRDEIGEAFVERFWLVGKNRLADRVTDGVQDDTIRPNMVIAAALDPSPLSKEQRQAVVELSRAELLTPRGLRTLSPRYLRYRGRFRGNQSERDDAYHQGTVWPWLLGFHVEAELRAFGRSAAAKRRLHALLDGFEPHLGEHGVAQVSEVFDGDPPHRPGGCFAQAWSVGELLRAYALLEPRKGAGGRR
jgi:predicted glycogen debranching enzyme